MKLILSTDARTCPAIRGRWWATITMCTWALLAFTLGHPAHGQDEVAIWEFSPYKVKVWYAFDPQLPVSGSSRARFIKDFEHAISRTFQAAWRTDLSQLPVDRRGQVFEHLDRLDVESLRREELVLTISLNAPDARTIRTYEAAIEQLDQIHVTAQEAVGLRKSAETYGLEEDSLTAQLISKLAVEDEGLGSLRAKLESADITAALVPRSQLPEVTDFARTVITLIPWQTEAILRQHDKLFFCLVGAEGEDFTFRLRELDCPMHFLGETFSSSTPNWSQAARLACDTLIRAFAPIARVEDAEVSTAELRHRAGGLIVNADNPARIRIGDVMQPIVRRDDRNGIPTLLEPLSWTYAAITHSDGVKMQANVYTYSGGPGLRGRQNRRTQRILLRSRTRYPQTDIKIVVRNSDRPQPGCQVYERDLLTDQFRMLGRTDWRGRFSVSTPTEPKWILPEPVRKERLEARRKAKRAAELAAEQAEAADQQAVGSGDAEQSAGGDALEEQRRAVSDAAAELSLAPRIDTHSDAYNPREDPDVIRLNHPLKQLYIKNGDTVLAKLPLVPGLKRLEVAELPDDSRRLRAEAFVRGFQSEILDLIGLRNLLAARIQLHLGEGELEKAQQVLDDLRRLRNYNEMADQLSAIQRRMLDESEGSLPRLAQVRIDNMFQTTRDMLQKYLQDDLVGEMERAVTREQTANSQ